MNNQITSLQAGASAETTAVVPERYMPRHYRFLPGRIACALMLMLLYFVAGNHLVHAQDGRFPVVFKNMSGKYSDDQIYIYGLAMNAANQWCYVTRVGDLVPMDPADINGPGHLTKGGMNFANYAFRLSDAGNFRMAAHARGGRFYISVGEPMYIRVAPEGVGVGWGAHNLMIRMIRIMM
jgi:hypothetical protein